MRRVIIALAATIAGLLASATPINAAPSATLTSPMADGGLVQKVQVYPRHYYRQHPYGAPPVVHACRPLSTPCRPLSTSCHPLSTSCRPLSTSCRRHVRQAVANITTGMVKTASTPATTGPTWERGRSRNARTLLCCTHSRAAWRQSFTFPHTCSENAAAVKVEDWYIKDRE